MATEELDRMNKMSMEGGGPPHSRSPYAPPPSVTGPRIAPKFVDSQVLPVRMIKVR